jgi:LysM repeat protein
MSAKTLSLVVLVAFSFTLASCVRSASTPPPATETANPNATGGATATYDPLAILAQGATQTFQAASGTIVAPTAGTPVATPLGGIELPTATPIAVGSPVVVGTPAPTYTAPPLVKPASYTLQSGEFPYCIARRFDVNPNELLTLNGLSSGDLYEPGMTLTIPQTDLTFPGDRALLAHPATYTVLSGDTIYSVACKYGDVDPLGIAAANGLQSPYTLTVGQSIQIP